MEPTAFESWVLGELAEAGYEARRTLGSGDRGADGLAIFCDGEEAHTIIVQCKHMQPNAKCGVAAVREVLSSLSEYDLVGEKRPMVVTNGAGFTRGAERLGAKAGVRLVDRYGLGSLRRWRDRGR